MHTTDTKLALNSTGVWEIRWSERDPGTGSWRSKRVSTRTADRNEAEAFRREFLTARQDSRTRAGGPIPTVSEIIDAYLAARGSYMSDTQALVLNRVRREIGGLVPAELTNDVLQSYGASRKLAPPSARRELGALIAAFNRAVRARIIRREDVPFIDLPPPGAPRDLWLNEEQEAEYHALAMGDSIGKPVLSRVTRFVALALDTAARKEAIHQLRWDRVDLQAGCVDYRLPGVGQTNKRRVPVPIADRLLPVLERARWEWDRGGRQDPYVIGAGSVRTVFEGWLAGTPYPWATAHVLRHTWATLAARAGVPTWQIAGVLGDDPRTVERTYLHHCPGHLRAAVNRQVG